MKSPEVPALIADEAQLDALLATPTPALVDMMKRIDGDLIILGIAGKMGVSLGELAVNAIRAAGVRKRVIGVARFSDKASRDHLERHGVETIQCDLLDRDAVDKLPDAANVVYMAGRKFGTEGQEDLTWAMNVVAPAHCAHRYRQSRIMAFSTGCVYELVKTDGPSSVETDVPHPIGDYAQSCLGRERVFSYYSRAHGTKVCLARVYYAIDLRYGVLHDIGQAVLSGGPVELSAGYFNCIWQRDANAMALLALEQCASPAVPLNMTGPEKLSTRAVAEEFGRLFNKPVDFRGQEGSICYLGDASRAIQLFGSPLPAEQLIRWQAEWLKRGGRSLGKPTHFAVTDGKY